jgi:deoxyribodipyrimidine photo-lyase
MNATADAALVWFRRDLRAFDHAALSRALQAYTRVYCVFVFDTEILDALEDRNDRRVEFIWLTIKELDATLRQMGGGLIVRHGRASAELPRLARDLGVRAVFANRDYEPQAIRRDATVAEDLAQSGIEFNLHKDQVIFERDEIMSGSNRPYSVYTAYKNAWLKRLTDDDLQVHPIAELASRLAPPPDGKMPSLQELGFISSDLASLEIKPGMSGARDAWDKFAPRLADYESTRDFPALDGTSHLGVHLRFGTLSIRTLARHVYYAAGKGVQVWLSELIWREFFQMILYHHPRVTQNAFRTEFDAIVWDDREDLFQAWCDGRTGYPIVDAAMRQLNQTGFMHNRLRMIAASFLVKDLHIHWLKGERYFARKLLDYDLAANNGNWQWAASTGCDAQPYFRIFNPLTQSERFDPEGVFIKRFVPELAGLETRDIHAPWNLLPIEQQACGVLLGRDYPAPIVDHEAARAKTLALFKAIRADAA